MILLSSASKSQELRDKMIRNFIARGMSCAESVFLVWRNGSEQDAWILYRTLLDRLVHLHNIIENNSFNDFEEYSFFEMYKARDRLLCSSEMKSKVPDSLRQLQRAQRSRYLQLKAKGVIWRRPKAEDVLKSMNLSFLYHFGYDYASMHDIHPMADDGENDFIRITSPKETSNTKDETIVKNTILIQSLLISEGLNGGSLKWMAIVYSFLEQLQKHLSDNKDIEFHATFYKIGKNWPELQICTAR